MAWEGRYGYAYDEPAFRHLLAVERTRTERLGLPIILLLVELKSPPAPFRVDPVWTRRLFSALSACVRETDIVGWHRRNRVAGVVFTDLGDTSRAEVSRFLRARVAAALDRRLPKTLAFHVHTRTHGQARPTASSGLVAEVGAGEVGTGEDRCSISA
jgi:hypothetical protein